MLKFLIFLVCCISSALALKCHICQNSHDPLCFELEKANGKFLRECKAGENECAVLQERSTDPFITRMCVAPSWRCDDAKFKCDKCSSDACNTDNEVKPKKIANIIPLTNEIGDLLKANTTAIGIIALLITLSIIWCAIQCCSRKTQAEDTDDCDEYYENEVYFEQQNDLKGETTSYC